MFSVLFLLLTLLYYSDGDPTSDAIQTSESAMIMTRVRSLTCHSSVNLSRFVGQMVVYHEWNQAYPGNLSAMNLPSIEAFNTQYTLELHKFDNNTNIYSMISVYNASNGLEHVFNYALDCSVLLRKWINLVDDDIYRYQFDHILTYVGTKSVKFSCLQYLNLSNLLEIQIGWITTAGDKIFTYKEKEILINLTDVYNGSMLCCLYYTTSDLKNGKQIQRFVKDKTLLIYQKETPNSKGQPTGTTTESYCENEGNRNNTASPTITQFNTDTSTATGKNLNTTNKTAITAGTINETRKYSGITNERDHKTNNTNTTDRTAGTKNETSKYSGSTQYETDQETNNTNTSDTTAGTKNETSKYSGSTKYETDQETNTAGKTTGATNRTDSSNHDADTDYVIIIISSIFAILVLLLVGFCAIRRHYLKKTNRSKRAQLPLPQIPDARLRPTDEPDINTPFYLNLLFRRECEIEIQAREEPHYEEVMYQ